MFKPLADEIRPASIDDIVGQEHLLAKGRMLRRLIDSGSATNMIFYGPSGTGKTTLASIIAASSGRRLYKLNATTASISDIKEIISDVDTLLAPQGVLLYLDEIQYFNKKQQQSLLEFLENGKISMIASTTENPYFYVYNAILSRCTVFEFKSVPPSEVAKAVRRGFDKASERYGVKFECNDEVIEHISYSCGGDVRKSLNAVEMLVSAYAGSESTAVITLEDALQVSQRSAMRYDRDGDSHYDILSAFQKSIRGSDPDAGVHYLARLLEAGDLPSVCRRLLVIAAEDIGLAYPQAISITKACVDSALQLGLPEARIPLADAVIMLATAPKSNSGIEAIDAALKDIRNGKGTQIPSTIQDTHYSGAKKLGRGGYKYAHAYPDHYVRQQYLPDDIRDAQYYVAGENKT
ncbi:MAG: replication-associated recombination protein A, partial [Oscillospiraceae bacterium]|nr:replication-associated recombination protein A [Oscillospiraceae bacterium]